MIKVLIDRKIKEGRETAYWEMISELRVKAIPRRGYFSGQTWVDTNDPTHTVVISTWLTHEAWETWLNSPERRAIEDALEPMLAEPVSILVFRPPEGIKVR
ncbi:MAG: antibiotic biosynthesis monooxygenase [Chloroflexi bacterium]|nr:antibiotic biosynthesis monooxygenase [Chloroflexota bacterium]